MGVAIFIFSDLDFELGPTSHTTTFDKDGNAVPPRPLDSPFSFRNAALLAIENFQSLEAFSELKSGSGSGAFVIMDDNCANFRAYSGKSGGSFSDCLSPASLTSSLSSLKSFSDKENLAVAGCTAYRPTIKHAMTNAQDSANSLVFKVRENIMIAPSQCVTSGFEPIGNSPFPKF